MKLLCILDELASPRIRGGWITYPCRGFNDAEGIGGRFGFVV